MKSIFTIAFALFCATSFSQVDPNGGSTRDDHTTGIEKIDIAGSVTTAVYNGKILVRTSDNTTMLKSIKVYDLNGSLLASDRLNSSTGSIDVAGYSAGIYLISIDTDKATITKKVFITGN
jgi:hypothetical protein